MRYDGIEFSLGSDEDVVFEEENVKMSSTVPNLFFGFVAFWIGLGLKYMSYGSWP